MNGSLLIWGGLALSVFWCVGVYNRLMRLQARGLSALGSVKKYMKQYVELMEQHHFDEEANVATVACANIHSISADWQKLQSLLVDLDSAVREAEMARLAVKSMQKLGAVLGSVEQCWESLCARPVDLAGPLVPDTLRSQWVLIDGKVQTARGGLNQILSKYNEAIEQFPARLVASVMHFEPAGLL